MSCGFARQGFRIAAAVDRELGKPTAGSSECNATYLANIGVVPVSADLATIEPSELAAIAGIKQGEEPDVLACCPPCTDFSRAVPRNHGRDGERNALAGRVADFVAEFRPSVVVIENARELIRGRNAHHHRALVRRLRDVGYQVRSEVQMLSRVGLPQSRERALVVASRVGRPLTLRDLWRGCTVRQTAVTVRTALARLAEAREANPDDPDGDAWPGMSPPVKARIAATPIRGGSWTDLAASPRTAELLTRECRARWARGDTGSHPDIYGRMHLDRPAPTIKRECSHVGNGRYGHPLQDRLMSVREMAVLQGFPFDYRFLARAIASRYAHIGDAVPPLVSYQLAAVARWMLDGRRPAPDDWIMPGTTLRAGDLVRTQ